MSNNRSRPTKSRRRSKQHIKQLKAALYEIAKECRPASVRQIFYQAVSMGLVEKSEREYKGTIVRLLTSMRKGGELPYSWISDSSRWMRKPRTHDDIEAALEDSIEFYRRSLWRDSSDYVEVWLEKEALSGVLFPVTSKWDVPLMVTRGYPSLSFLSEAANAINDQDKNIYLYYLGDLDPSGVDIPRHVEETLGDLCDESFDFERIAVDKDQVENWNLPTRPTKRTDSRAKNFAGRSVELDSIRPQRLRSLVELHIKQHIDADLLERTERIEAAERESAQTIIQSWRDSLTTDPGATHDH